MFRALALAGILASIGADLSAHRRDELLQAVRVAIEPGGVQLEVDLTPGIALAADVITEIDGDRDGAISAAEQSRYASGVLQSIILAIDDRRLRVRAAGAAFPAVDAMQRGEGTIRLGATAAFGPLAAGAHQLSFRNDHHPGGSAYLANALVPQSHRIAITTQRRDSDQRELLVDFRLQPSPFRLSSWWLAAGLALATAVSVATYGKLLAPKGAHCCHDALPPPQPR